MGKQRGNEIEEKFATKWGSFENILSENGENFVLKLKRNLKIYMTAPLIKP